MATEYVLIDFENVTPKDLERFAGLERVDCHVLVFVGALQSKIPLAIAKTMQRMGERAEYVEISGTGHNALDFHLACYAGRIIEKDPHARIHVVSHDAGFDPLIAHLQGRRFAIDRVTGLADIPPLAPAANKGGQAPANRLAMVAQRLAELPNKPGSRAALANHLVSLFRKTITKEEAPTLVDELFKQGFIREDGGRLVYAGE